MTIASLSVSQFLCAIVQKFTFHVFFSWVTGAAVVNAFYATSKNQIGNSTITHATENITCVMFRIIDIGVFLNLFFSFYQCSQQESSSYRFSAKARVVLSTTAVSAWSLVMRSHTASITMVGLSVRLLWKIMSACGLKNFPFCNWYRSVSKIHFCVPPVLNFRHSCYP